jgi:hypothetical protein
MSSGRDASEGASGRGVEVAYMGYVTGALGMVVSGFAGLDRIGPSRIHFSMSETEA